MFTKMKGGLGIIGKLSQRNRRINLLKGLKIYFLSDSYMYGPIINPKNYRTSNSSASSRKPSRQETLWQTKRTSLTLSSVKVHKSLKPSVSNQSNETGDPGDPALSGDHEVNFRDIPIESSKRVKHAIEHSAAPSTVDNINQTDRPEKVAKRIGENKKGLAKML